MTPEDRQRYEKMLSELERVANAINELADAIPVPPPQEVQAKLVAAAIKFGLADTNECLTRTINEARKVLTEA